MRTLWIGYVAIGLAVVIGVVPASFAQISSVLDHGKPAVTEVEAEDRRTHEDMSDGSTPKAWEHMGAFVAEPIGRFWVGPEFTGGDAIYVRRDPVREGITTVEVSTTPFMPELAGEGELTGRPDEQPAGW